MVEYSLDMLHVNGTILRGTDLQSHVLNQLQQLRKPLMTSIGPKSCDKIIINTLGDVKTTSDGATILRSLHVTNPFMQLITRLAYQQDEETGDATTTVVLLAIALVNAGTSLLKDLPRSAILRGYKLAYRECSKLLKSKSASLKNDMQLFKDVAATSLRAKVGGCEKSLVSLVAEAHSRSANPQILKAFGGSLADSFSTDGVGINCRWDRNAALLKPGNAKVVLLTCDLSVAKLPLNVHVRLENAESASLAHKAEQDVASRRVAAIIRASATLIISTRTVDAFAASLLAKAGVSVITHVEPSVLELLGDKLGISVVRSLSDEHGNDNVSNKSVATAKVSIHGFSDQELIVVHARNASTIILRGSSEQLLDEAERAVTDATKALAVLGPNPSVLPGGGACEAFMYIYLSQLADCLPKDAAVIRAYAEALLDVPKLLCENAGLCAESAMSELLKVQNALSQANCADAFAFGFDLTSEFLINNNLTRGVIEPASVRLKALRTATEAAVAVLRINEMIVMNPDAPKPTEHCG